MKTASNTRRHNLASRRLADLRASVIAAVLRARNRADSMLPDVLSPFEVEALAASDELLDEVRRLFDAAVLEVQRP